MFKKVQAYMLSESLVQTSDSILVAVSAGIDSMSLLHVLMRVKGIKIGVAHCNFNLRDQESDLDQALVKDFCRLRKIPFHVKHFDTKSYKAEEKISTQMAARWLRYDWFNELCEVHGYTKIAIGTHKDDALETYFINLFRGSGLKGLTGIKSKRDNIIRPFLCVGRSDIQAYLQTHNIPFREDASNASTHYLRNKIRHQVLPLIEKTYPGASQNVLENSEHLNGYAKFIKASISSLKEKFIIEEFKNCTKFNKELLNEIQDNYVLLYDILSPFSFTTSQVKDIISSRESVGAIFKSTSHTLYIERASLMVRINEGKADFTPIEISENTNEVKAKHFSLKLSHLLASEFKVQQFKDSNRFACFDFDLLQFPLSIDAWKSGDAFVPFGMKGKKKKWLIFCQI